MLLALAVIDENIESNDSQPENGSALAVIEKFHSNIHWRSEANKDKVEEADGMFLIVAESSKHNVMRGAACKEMKMSRTLTIHEAPPENDNEWKTDRSSISSKTQNTINHEK